MHLAVLQILLHVDRSSSSWLPFLHEKKMCYVDRAVRNRDPSFHVKFKVKEIQAASRIAYLT